MRNIVDSDKSVIVGSERVMVSVRLRPFIEEELSSKDRSVCIENIDTEKNAIISISYGNSTFLPLVKKDFEKRQFQFDHVFDPKSQ
jgi:kinesin family member 5